MIAVAPSPERRTICREKSARPSQSYSAHSSCCSHSRSYSVTVVKTAKQEMLAKRRQREQVPYVNRMRKRLRKVLRSMTNECARRVEQNLEPLPRDMTGRWPREMLAAERPIARGAALAGWTTVGRQHGARKQMEDEITDLDLSQSAVFIGADPRDTPGVDYFTTRTVSQRVDRYLIDTAREQTKTKTKQIQGAYDSLIVRGGLTKAQLSKALRADSIGFDRNYANLVSRTTTNWAYNEAAVARYGDLGVTHMVWYATADELTCPFCSVLHGQVVSIESGFVDGNVQIGGQVQGVNGNVRDVFMTTPAWGIAHPPLHPNCRCTILPELRNIPLLEDVYVTDPPELPRTIVPVVPPPVPAPVPTPPPAPTPKPTPTTTNPPKPAAPSPAPIADVDGLGDERAQFTTPEEWREGMLKAAIDDNENTAKLAKLKEETKKAADAYDDALDKLMDAVELEEVEKLKSIAKKLNKKYTDAYLKEQEFIKSIPSRKQIARQYLSNDKNWLGFSRQGNLDFSDAVVDGKLVKFTANEMDRIAKTMEGVSNLFNKKGWQQALGPEDTLPTMEMLRNFPGDNGSWQNITKIMRLKPHASEGTISHEFAHVISYLNNEKTLRMQNKYYRYRTKGEAIETLPKYDSSIKGRKDKWGEKRVYAGRDYQWASEDTTPEVITVGMQSIWDDPIEFAKNDPHYFDFMMSILKGVKFEY